MGPVVFKSFSPWRPSEKMTLHRFAAAMPAERPELAALLRCGSWVVVRSGIQGGHGWITWHLNYLFRSPVLSEWGLNGRWCFQTAGAQSGSRSIGLQNSKRKSEHIASKGSFSGSCMFCRVAASEETTASEPIQTQSQMAKWSSYVIVVHERQRCLQRRRRGKAS